LTEFYEESRFSISVIANCKGEDMEILGKVCQSTIQKRRKEGLRKLEAVYGRPISSWEIPALVELETDVSKLALLRTVLGYLLPDPAKRAEELAREKFVHDTAVAECAAMAEAWGL
jgi:hypothetical protein